MNNLSEEKKKESEETKELVGRMNVEAVAKILTDIQDENHKIKAGQVDLKRMVPKVTQDLAELRAGINTLKAMGARGNIGGTGSTVHEKEE